MKRVVAAVLWFLTGWWIGAFVAFGLEMSSILAPLLGLAAAGFVALDPRRVFWARPAEAVAPPHVESAPEAV